MTSAVRSGAAWYEFPGQQHAAPSAAASSLVIQNDPTTHCPQWRTLVAPPPFRDLTSLRSRADNYLIKLIQANHKHLKEHFPDPEKDFRIIARRLAPWNLERWVFADSRFGTRGYNIPLSVRIDMATAFRTSGRAVPVPIAIATKVGAYGGDQSDEHDRFAVYGKGPDPSRSPQLTMAGYGPYVRLNVEGESSSVLWDVCYADFLGSTVLNLRKVEKDTSGRLAMVRSKIRAGQIVPRFYEASKWPTSMPPDAGRADVAVVRGMLYSSGRGVRGLLRAMLLGVYKNLRLVDIVASYVESQHCPWNIDWVRVDEEAMHEDAAAIASWPAPADRASLAAFVKAARNFAPLFQDHVELSELADAAPTAPLPLEGAHALAFEAIKARVAAHPLPTDKTRVIAFRPEARFCIYQAALRDGRAAQLTPDKRRAAHARHMSNLDATTRALLAADWQGALKIPELAANSSVIGALQTWTESRMLGDSALPWGQDLLYFNV